MSWDPSDDADDFWEDDAVEGHDEDGEGNPDPEDAFIGWYWGD